MSNRITEIQERLAKATPGNWKWTHDRMCLTFEGAVDAGDFILWVQKYANPIEDDADFIANAPEDIAYLLSKVKRYEGYFEDIAAESSDIYAIRKARAALAEQEG